MCWNSLRSIAVLDDVPQPVDAPDRLIWVSIGDSAACAIDGGEIVDLTVNQVWKPLLGSQDARRAGFSHGPLTGVLLVGTDGFFYFAERDVVPPAV